MDYDELGEKLDDHFSLEELELREQTKEAKLDRRYFNQNK
jgi:hypothetical protein